MQLQGNKRSRYTLFQISLKLEVENKLDSQLLWNNHQGLRNIFRAGLGYHAWLGISHPSVHFPLGLATGLLVGWPAWHDLYPFIKKWRLRKFLCIRFRLQGAHLFGNAFYYYMACVTKAHTFPLFLLTFLYGSESTLAHLLTLLPVIGWFISILHHWI